MESATPLHTAQTRRAVCQRSLSLLLSRVSMRQHAEREVFCLSALWYCIQTGANIVKRFSPPGRGINLVFELHRRYKIPKNPHQHWR